MLLSKVMTLWSNLKLVTIAKSILKAVLTSEVCTDKELGQMTVTTFSTFVILSALLAIYLALIHLLQLNNTDLLYFDGSQVDFFRVRNMDLMGILEK